MNSILKEYNIHGIIGKGTFSIVKLGIDRLTGEKVAIKILNKKKILNKNDAERVEREINILKNINHINLIKINKIKEDSENYYMIMEYCESGELFNYIVKKVRLDENESAYYYYQLINGLEYIHSKNIVHRDLKPENLLLYNKNILKIIDFGLSNFNNDDLLSTPCGSPCYASPEMISGKKYDGNLIDIWSTGIILYAMLCGYLPFEGQTNEILYKNIVICKVEYPKFLSDISIDLLKKILVSNPEKRIKLSEIKEHPFYYKGKELFKKINPSIFEKCEKNYRLKKIEEKYKKILNFDYSKSIIRTEGNEKKDMNRRKNIRSMNLDIVLNINNNSKNRDEQIYSFYNTPEKKDKFHFKKLNPMIKVKYNNNKYFLKLKKDTNNHERYNSNYKEKNITDLQDYNLHFRKNSENSNIEKFLFRKDLPNLLYLVNSKKNFHLLKNIKNFQKINNTPNKKRNIFSSIDIEHSNLKFNFYNLQKEKKYKYNNNNDDNKNKKIIETFQFNSKIINSYKQQGNRPKNLENISPAKNYIITKIKSINVNKKFRNNTDNNTKIFEKFNSEEKKKEKHNNNYILEKRNKINSYNYNSASISKNKNNIDKEKNNRLKHASGISFNNNIIEEMKINQTKKDIKSTQENRFNKYFKLNNTKISKKNASYRKFKENYLLNNNNLYLNYDINKYHLNDNIINNNLNENDKNCINYNPPSITINNTNYNLNLYEPKIYLSTLFSEDERKNNKLSFKKNINIPNKDKPIKKNIISKSKKYFDNIIKFNKYNHRSIINKKINSLTKQNYLTQEKSNINDSIKKNYNEKTFNIINNQKIEKLKTNIIFNRRKFNKNSKDNKTSNLKYLEKAFNNSKNKKNNDNKDSIIKNKYKKIKTNIKIDYWPDLLDIIRQKRNQNNKAKNEFINSEQHRHNIFSPSLTLENDNFNNNIGISNINNVNKNIIRNFFNKNKTNQKKKNNIKKNNVLDSLIRDFLNFSNIKSKDNSNMKHNFNFSNIINYKNTLV